MLTADRNTPDEARADGLLRVPGIRGSAVATGIKPDGALDLALVVADRPMAAAAVFTTSKAAAPPVELCRERLAADPHVRSIVVNSGNANALTGARGRRDAEAMVEALEQSCGGPGLVLSTGVIGEPLRMPPILAGIGEASRLLGDDAGEDVARAILTTDTCTKSDFVRVEAGDRARWSVGGVAKGSGMIHPDMATMLAVIATDAPVGPATLDTVLREVVDRSFHEITVDGDTSTNDAVVLLARDPSPTGPALDADTLPALADAIAGVARSLALQIVRDGEGASRWMHLAIEGGRDEAEARRVARGIACPSLVKTALAGGDANWGRIIAAAGTCGVPFDLNRLTLTLGDEVVFRGGTPTRFDEAAVDRAFEAEEVAVTLDLGRGSARARMVTTDLTRRYVEINADYRS